ncbi:hypothetical protein [Saccharothrix syringae]|uniref:Uncharacterized protein n=1 Tax=Saccharothrix syringae TaxID=103733 RepID=A0A5Q0H2E0_SACSY|nr:hypothetical protein [Saccharothrix syringae]QFZ20378.1 hypothetical protein EKG83_25800 [Saccharothrix syringae]
MRALVGQVGRAVQPRVVLDTADLLGEQPLEVKVLQQILVEYVGAHTRDAGVLAHRAARWRAARHE